MMLIKKLIQWFSFDVTTSAARTVDKKVANILLKVAQKVATLNNWFKTSLKLVLTGF